MYGQASKGYINEVMDATAITYANRGHVE